MMTKTEDVGKIIDKITYNPQYPAMYKGIGGTERVPVTVKSAGQLISAHSGLIPMTLIILPTGHERWVQSQYVHR